MKLTQIPKLTVIPLVTAFSILFTSNAALADYITSQGSGGNYRYELWTDGNNNYVLKIWTKEATSDSPYITSKTFSSSRDALIYFDCNYTDNCPLKILLPS